MDKANFEQLVKGIKQMKRHLAGKRVRGIRTTRVDATDIQAIRKAANLSQPRFAKLIGVNLRTLQNWEQGRDTADRAGTRSAQDSRLEPEIGNQASRMRNGKSLSSWLAR